MSSSHSLSKLMADVIVVSRTRNEGTAHLARRLAAELASHGTDHPVAVVTGRPEELPELPVDREQRARLFLALLDDPTTEFVQRRIEKLMPEELRRPEPALLAQLIRNAELRARFLETHEAWTAAQVARFAGSRAKNTSALAGRWRGERWIFAVEHGSETLYPAFQFDPEHQRPKPVMRELLSLFHEHEARDWEIALWTAAPHARLSGPPLTVLDRDPAAVVEAARATYEHSW